MPFELICQHPFVERLDGTRVRSRRAGEHIRDPDEIASAKRSHPAFVVQIWTNEVEPAPDEPNTSVDDSVDTPDPAPADAPAQP